MLGARTKQVHAYGKRSKRIVNASDSPGDALNIFADEPPSQWAPVASRMKRRENLVSSARFASPKTVRIHKKKVPIPTQTSDDSNEESQAIGKNHSGPTFRRREAAHPVIPARAPFSQLLVNAPRSPLLPVKRRSKASTPPTSLKPYKALIDIDIVILDDDGTPISKERRVSRTGIQVNSINSKGIRAAGATKQLKAASHNSQGDDLDVQPRRPARRAAVTIHSDDSESEAEPQSRAEEVHEVNRPHSTLEVVVPAALHQIKPNLQKTRSSDAKPPVPSLPHQPPLPLLSHSRFHYVSSPTPRTRQLTPIKRGTRNKPFQPPSPPSAISFDLELSLELEQLSVESSALDLGHSAFPDVPAHLKPLLQECYQEETGLADFSSFIEAFAFDPVVRPFDGGFYDLAFRKIGEASYSEVFGVGNVVLKIIPLRDETAGVGLDDEDGPFTSDAKDVLREIIVTRAMGEMCQGFVELLKTYIVRGKYPQVLLKLWDEYHQTKGSESIRPDTFLVSQCYAIIVLPNGGPDLEQYKFISPTQMGWRQASSIFWQVAKSLALAEQLVSFEHRDLHWGQILVKNLTPSRSALRSRSPNVRLGVSPPFFLMDDPCIGVRATIIDLGLSRMDARDGTGGEMLHWTPLEEEIFLGDGDYQFDVYRIMKHYNRGDWESFKPITNVFWLHYLITKLLFFKGLKPPSIKPLQTPSTEGKTFSEKECYECLLEVERWLVACVASVSPAPMKPAAKKGRRNKTQITSPVQAELSSRPSCAGDVIVYAAKKGWIRPIS